MVANVTPGGLPTKLAALSGLRLAGVAGGVLAGFVTTLPGTLMGIGLVALFGLLGERGVLVIEFASVGISAYVVVVLLDYVIRIVGTAPKRGVALAIVLAVALATGPNSLIRLTGLLIGREWEAGLPEFGSVQIVVLALAIIVGYSLLTGSRRRSSEPRLTAGAAGGDAEIGGERPQSLARPALIVTGIFAGLMILAFAGSWAVAGMPGLVFMGLIALSIAATFGGGNAYIGIGAGFFVTTGMISAGMYYGQLVPIANATPGPLIMKLAAQMGWVFGVENYGYVAAAVLAACALVQGVGVSNVFAMLVFAGYERYANAPILRDLAVYILPVIGGMLITTALDMSHTAAVLGAQAGPPVTAMAWAFVALVAVSWWIVRRFRIMDLWIILGAGVLTLGVLGAIVWGA